MANKTSIEWTATINQDDTVTPGATWNPIRANFRTPVRDPERGAMETRVGWHCEHVTEACRFCYAEGMNNWRGTGLSYKPGHLDNGDIEVFLDEKVLLQPLSWRKPKKIFPCSMTDLFGRWVSDEWLDRIFAVMALCPQHTFIVLTKRPERMREYLGNNSLPDSAGYPAEDIRVALTTLTQTPSRRKMAPALKQIPLRQFCQQIMWPPPNIWAGSSCSNQEDADRFIPIVLSTPLAKRIVSLEPLLGPVDLCSGGEVTEVGHIDWLRGFRGSDPPIPKLDWVIVGGESGRGARPFDITWARSIRAQCEQAGTSFFMKQVGSKPMLNGFTGYPIRDKKGGDIRDFPEDLKVRQWPTTA